ncbi:MAG: hypothetical protein ACKOKG_13065, partial [Verrucomicrobiota bacterium]
MRPTSRKSWIGWLAALLLLGGAVRPDPAWASGDEVLVVYNSRMPASGEVARHYARKRGVPESQLLGLPLPEGANLSR